MEGIHPNGKATFTAGAAIAKGEFVKFSSGKVVKASAATDVCIGVALDSAHLYLCCNQVYHHHSNHSLSRIGHHQLNQYLFFE